MVLLIDFTQLPEGTITGRHRPVVKCPECGRNGEFVQIGGRTAICHVRQVFYGGTEQARDKCHLPDGATIESLKGVKT